MKRLFDTPITRTRRSVGDWIDSAQQATDAGRNEFAARQEQRRRQMQQVPTSETAKVSEIATIRRRGPQ
jgi:hypothetical protein